MRFLIFITLFGWTEIFARAENLSALLTVGKSNAVAEVKHDDMKKQSDSLDLLLSNRAMQYADNSSYQAAEKVLNDPALKSQYRDQLLTIEIFFDEYIDQIVRSYNQEQSMTKVSLQELLSLVHPTISSSPIENLSDLLTIIDKATYQKNQSQKRISLGQLLQHSAPLSSVANQQKESLVALLSDDSSTSFNAKKSVKNLSLLLEK